MKVLITGANRGIGLGLTEYYLAKGAHVFACSRNPDGARELWEQERDYGKRCQLVRLDVTDARDLAALPETLGDQAVDLLINNAGMLPENDSKFASLQADAMLKTFQVNVIGPLSVTQAVLPALRRSKHPIVVNITSKMGSLGDNRSGGNYAYRISKTALNMLNLNMAHELKGLICVAIHPGWVETRMGGPNAPLTVATSISGITAVINKLTVQDSGKFFDYTGGEIPW